MKKTTLLLFSMLIVALFTSRVHAQETCTADGTKLYYTSNTVWSNSEWYKIIDIDAETLTNSGIVAHNGVDGSVRTSVYNSGTFGTPVYKWNDTTKSYDVTTSNWPVKYYLAALSTTFYTSARTKVDLGTATSSSFTDVCYGNKNEVKQSPIWDKKGFIELSRQASEVANTAPSRHGYIEINDLPQVERVQWSFSSLAWKRGFKLDIKHNDGPWEPLHWEANNINGFVPFGEQGYAFEEIIGKQEDPTSRISLRWRIWDGDSIHIRPDRTTGETFTLVNSPYAQQQDVRIHQIKIFSGIDAPEAPNAVKKVTEDAIKIYRSENSIVLSETANVEVFSYDGKKMYAGHTNNIDVTNLSKGLYIVKAAGKSGNTLKKIVI